MKRILSVVTGLLILVLASAGSVAGQDQEDGWVNIFNGENLDGWDGDMSFWSVQNGVIVGETSEDNPTDENTFLIWQDGQPDNFEIKFEYRFVQLGDEVTGNSGFQFRAEQFTDEDNPELEWRVRGHQADFATNRFTGIHYDEGGRGFLAERGEIAIIKSDTTITDRFASADSLLEHTNPVEWNDVHVYANNDVMQLFINGQLMHILIDHTDEAEEEGIIAFQLHTGDPMRIEFRDVQFRMID